LVLLFDSSFYLSMIVLWYESVHCIDSYGPRETLKAKEYNSRGKIECEFKYAPFSCINKRGNIQVGLQTYFL
jgi:hypothetical protein